MGKNNNIIKFVFIALLALSTSVSGQHHMMNVLASQSAPAPETGLKAALVSVWELDEASGSTSFDAHSSNNGTSLNATVNQTGITNITPCYSFSATGRIDYGDIEEMSFTDGAGNDESFTLSAWIDPAAIGSNYAIISKNDGVVNYEYFVIIRSTGKILVRLYNGGAGTDYIGKEGTTVLSAAGGWYHVVVTYDSSELDSGIKIYINGVDDTGVAVNNGTYNGMSNTASKVYVGQWSTASNYDGLVDQPAAWNREMISTGIDSVYSSGNAKAYVDW